MYIKIKITPQKTE